MFIEDRNTDIAKTCLEPVGTIFTDTFSRFQRFCLSLVLTAAWALIFGFLSSAGISWSTGIRKFLCALSTMDFLIFMVYFSVLIET